MTRAGPHIGAHAIPDFAAAPPAIEKRHVLLPGQADHDAQSPFPCTVEQPAWRDRVGANGVETVTGDQREVALDRLPVVKLIAVLVWPEGPVCRAFNPQLGFAGVDEFS